MHSNKPSTNDSRAARQALSAGFPQLALAAPSKLAAAKAALECCDGLNSVNINKKKGVTAISLSRESPLKSW